MVYRPCAVDAPGAVSCTLDDLIASNGQEAVVPPPLTHSDMEAVLAHIVPSIKAQHMVLLEAFRARMEGGPPEPPPPLPL